MVAFGTFPAVGEFIVHDSRGVAHLMNRQQNAVSEEMQSYSSFFLNSKLKQDKGSESYSADVFLLSRFTQFDLS